MNSPLLDVAIGLVFIFLLYSLLVTSIQEAIASLFGLRARMLKKAIVDGMLSDTLDSVLAVLRKRLNSFVKNISNWFKRELKHAFKFRIEMELPLKLGDQFYKHALIRNYGSGLCFSLPSYIPADNFSTVLTDILLDDFKAKLKNIAQYKFDQNPTGTETAESIETQLTSSPKAIKIKELLDYYKDIYAKSVGENPAIDKDTLKVIRMFLENSNYDFEKIIQNLEKWFDSSMDRVTGWYKRQSQIIIFVISMLIAVTFNVDTIEIATKLSTDEDARDKLVQLAIASADRYKDDPRVKKINGVADTSSKDSAIFTSYQANLDSARKLINRDICRANSIIAIGWGDFGKKRDSAKVLSALFQGKDSAWYKQKLQTTTYKNMINSLYNKHWIKYKIGYVLQEATRGRKFLGFLLTAFAISLGAPFWFDLLSKLIKLRGTGKKEDSTGSSNAVPSSSSKTSTQAVG